LCRHLLVAGGGGSAKTGVANGFEIYELFHNGQHFVAEEIQRHETGSEVIMNMSMKSIDSRSLLVVGQESHSQMFVINSKVGLLPPKEMLNRRESSTEIRQRKNRERTESVGNEKPSEDGPRMKRVYFEIKAADSIQTDFTQPEPLQRVVRISPNGRFMATGGLDGHVRVWNFPRMTPLVDIVAHKKEIDDIDFSPDNKHLLSVAKDGTAIVWSTNTGKEVMKLQWTPPEGVKYMFKRCRYATIEGESDRYRLFTLSNPFGKAGKQKGFVQQWNTETGRLNNIVGIDESLSALAVRDDGRFLAVGTMFSGSVSIYIAFSLQRVLHVPGAHSMFVTGLEFIPVLVKDAPPISSDTEASVVSYSVDNRICIHSLQYRREFIFNSSIDKFDYYKIKFHILDTFPAWAAIVLIIVILFLTFLMCSYFQI
jgi:prolactin regulatory element-binding protein